jgi:hypothetical protein
MLWRRGRGDGWGGILRLFQKEKQPGAGFTLGSSPSIRTVQQRFQLGHALAMHTALGQGDGPGSIALLDRLQERRLPIRRGGLAGGGTGHG